MKPKIIAFSVIIALLIETAFIAFYEISTIVALFLYFSISFSCMFVGYWTNKEYTNKPADESILKKHSGKKLKVEASHYYGKKSGDNECATLFSCPGSRGNNGSGGIELIYCYTSDKFEPGDIVDVTYHEEDKELWYVGEGISKTSRL